jgi:hypothetical protein
MHLIIRIKREYMYFVILIMVTNLLRFSDQTTTPLFKEVDLEGAGLAPFLPL